MFVGSLLSTLLPHPWSCAPVLCEEFVEFDQSWGLGQLVSGLFLCEDINQFAQGLFQPILEVVGRDCPVVREELYCVGNPGTTCGWDVTLVISVVVESWSDIESSGSMFCP